MLVPVITAYPSPGAVERMHTPGAAMSMSRPKLLNPAKVSSRPPLQFDFPRLPGLPSKSVKAETVMTSP
jgi:hypothetical protein